MLDVENLEFKYHGNWGGPGYGAGRFTRDAGDKLDWSVKPIDDLDALYRMHDYDYGVMPHKDADRLYIKRSRRLPYSLKKAASDIGFRLKSGIISDNIDEPPVGFYPWEKVSSARMSRNETKMTGYGGTIFPMVDTSNRVERQRLPRINQPRKSVPITESQTVNSNYDSYTPWIKHSNPFKANKQPNPLPAPRRPKGIDKYATKVPSARIVNNGTKVKVKSNNMPKPKGKGRWKKRNGGKGRARPDLRKRKRGPAPPPGFRRRVQPGNRYKGPVARIRKAPTSYGVTTRSGNFTRFIQSKNPGCMGIETRLFLGTLKHLSTGGTSLMINTVELGGQMYLAPWNNQYTTVCPLSVFAVYFARFRIIDAAIEFCSTQPTSENRQITWCSIDDPCYWESVGVSTSVQTPSKANMNNMAGAMAFPAWMPNKRLRLLHTKAMLFTAGQTSQLFDYNDIPANIRNQYAGTFGIRIDGVTPTATESIGDIFLRIRVDFCNIVSQINNTIDEDPTVAVRRGNRDQRVFCTPFVGFRNQNVQAHHSG